MNPPVVFVKVARNFVDLTGRKFGRLTAVEYLGSINKKSKWRCVCDCGSESDVVYQSLINKATQSCGCLHNELLAARARKHGMRHSAEYSTWCHIIQRCTNENSVSWCDYGGRGIRVCNEWLRDFAAFYAHVGARPSPKHTLDRIKNEGHYEPGNVRWATASEQNRNRRPFRMGVSLRRELYAQRRTQPA